MVIVADTRACGPQKSLLNHGDTSLDLATQVAFISNHSNANVPN